VTEPAATERRSGFLAILDRWSPAFVTVAAVIAGYWLLVDTMLDGIKESVAQLRTETGQRLDGREEEDRDIRGVIQSTSDALRMELAVLGDRLVESNRDIGAQISKMRDDLVATMKDGDERLEQRFDKLDEKFDILLTRIDYETIEIPWERGTIMIENGVLYSQDGKELGTIPAVLRPE
jgi:hypothetical protein